MGKTRGEFRLPITSSIRNGFIDWAEKHLKITKKFQLDKSALPISTDVLESLFGVGKRLGTGCMKDADRIASRLPAFCGSFSVEDAKKVVAISVAQQNSAMNCGGSLIKLRRDILPHVGKLEAIAHQPDRKNFQLIRGSEVIYEVQKHGESVSVSLDTLDQYHVTVSKQLELLDQLSQFNFGRFLLQNQGLNGYWTHYALVHPRNKIMKSLPDLERFMLERAPVVRATQERFEIFLRENQKAVKNNAILACIPCGMMGELLYLDYRDIHSIKLTGIDYDEKTLEDAKNLSEQKNLTRFLDLHQKDAWNLNIKSEFDLISSNGLNIYESSDDKVTKLYQQFYDALKPNGKLVTSFLAEPSEWDSKKINQNDLLLQKIIFADIIQSKWQCYRSTQKTKEQLITAGFKDIQFINDSARIFPTVIAFK